MKRLIITLIIMTLCTSCLMLPAYKSYQDIGIISNEDTVYIHKNKLYNIRCYVSIKEKGDTCVLRETRIKNLNTNKERIRYKEEKFILQQ